MNPQVSQPNQERSPFNSGKSQIYTRSEQEKEESNAHIHLAIKHQGMNQCSQFYKLLCTCCTIAQDLEKDMERACEHPTIKECG